MAGKTLDAYIDYVNKDFFNLRRVSVIQTVGNFEVLESIVLEPYIDILKSNSILIHLTEDEQNRYKYKPQLLSQVVYGSDNLYYLILMLNDLTVEKFTPKKLYLLNNSDRELVENIINKERSLGTI